MKALGGKVDTSSEQQSTRCYIGWDVGAWNCDKNSKSRDAVVVLDENLKGLGSAWRGNLSSTILKQESAHDFLQQIFSFCGVPLTASACNAILAIDTPLGFSEPFQKLIASRLACSLSQGPSVSNPYLYRQTEQFLARHSHKPLSAVKDMLGSQATKGMHALTRFAPQITRCGVWADPSRTLTVIETYPAPCHRSQTLQKYVPGDSQRKHGALQDQRDAHICALVAGLYGTQPELLEPPCPAVPQSEGWIWVPKDVLSPS